MNSFSQNLDSLFAVSIDNSNVGIHWSTSTNPSIISEINVLKENTNSTFDILQGSKNISFDSINVNIINGFYQIDQSSNPDFLSNNYKLQLIKENGDTIYSKLSNSLHLSYSNNSTNNSTIFQWNSHIGNSISKYYIWRQKSTEFYYSIYDSTEIQNTSYIEMDPILETTNYIVCASLDAIIYPLGINRSLKSDWGPINCSCSQAITIQGTLAVSENQGSNLEISPNPATDRIIIESDKQIKTISVTNILGQNIAFQTLLSNEKNITISTNNFAPGIYLISINTGDKQMVKSVMVK